MPSWDWSSVDSAHTNATEFRAIENGVSLVKPTYDGITTAVDYQGHVIDKFHTNDTGYDTVQFANIPVDSADTIYAKAGTAIDLALGAFGIIMVLAGIVLARRKA